ncbi:MAG: ABC transporter permease [Sciscionella sp.]
MTTTTARPETGLPPLREPGAAGGLVEVFRRGYLLKLLVRKELRMRYQGSIVGLGWSYVQPLVYFLMYYWVIGLIESGRTPGRSMLIFCGLIMVQFGTQSLTQGARSVVKNKSLVRKINLPREMFPVSTVAVSVYHMLPMYAILFVGALISGWHPDPPAVLAIFLSFVLVVVWGLGIAMVMSAINVFFRDAENVAGTVNIALRWLVPMIYPFGLIMKHAHTHPILYQIYAANPLTSCVLLVDRAFWITTNAHPVALAHKNLPPHLFERSFILLGVGLLFLWVAQVIFRHLAGRFAEMV